MSKTPATKLGSTFQRGGLFVLLLLPIFILVHTEGTVDVTKFWVVWVQKILTFGPIEGYRQIGMDYPPFSSQALGLSAWLGAKCGIGEILSIKTSVAVALGITLLLFWKLTRHIWATLLLYAGLLLHTVADGYLDIYYAPFLLGALAVLRAGKFEWFSLLFSIAVCFKWQPLIIAPFLAIHVWRSIRDQEKTMRGLAWRIAQTALPALAVALAVRYTFGRNPLLNALHLTFTMHKIYSAYALNFYWVVTHALQFFAPDAAGALKHGEANIVNFDPSIQTLLRIPFYLALCGLLVLVCQRPLCYKSTVAYCLAGFLTYFMLSTGVHENHLFIPVVLAAWLFSMEAVTLETVLWIVVLQNLNLFLFYGVDGLGLKYSRTINGSLDIALIAALVNIAIYVPWIIPFFRRRAQICVDKTETVSAAV